MGLAAVSKGSESCRAGQCARCAPASRLGAPALPERGSALAPRGWGAASCPGCPWGVLGSAKPPMYLRWVLHRLPGVTARGWRLWGRVGASACPAAAPRGRGSASRPPAAPRGSQGTSRIPLLRWQELGTVPPQQAATLDARPEARQPKWEHKGLWVLGYGFGVWVGACCPCTTLGPARGGCRSWGAEGTSGTSRGGSRVRPQLQRCRGVRLCGTALGGVN